MKLRLNKEGTRWATPRGLTGFTLVELMIVVAVVGMLAAMAVPSMLRSREAAWKTTCQATLRQMQAAKAVAAIENGWSDNESASTLGNPFYMNAISQYLRAGVRPVCPTGPDCYYNGVSENATCTSGLVDHELQ